MTERIRLIASVAPRKILRFSPFAITRDARLPDSPASSEETRGCFGNHLNSDDGPTRLPR